MQEVGGSIPPSSTTCLGLKMVDECEHVFVKHLTFSQSIFNNLDFVLTSSIELRFDEIGLRSNR